MLMAGWGAPTRPGLIRVRPCHESCAFVNDKRRPSKQCYEKNRSFGLWFSRTTFEVIEFDFLLFAGSGDWPVPRSRQPRPSSPVPAVASPVPAVASPAPSAPSPVPGPGRPVFWYFPISDTSVCLCVCFAMKTGISSRWFIWWRATSGREFSPCPALSKMAASSSLWRLFQSSGWSASTACTYS